MSSIMLGSSNPSPSAASGLWTRKETSRVSSGARVTCRWDGITRQRHMGLLREAGRAVHETVLTFQDFHDADEVFMSGNLAKVTPVTAFDDTNYQVGPVTQQARENYWDWAHSV